MKFDLPQKMYELLVESKLEPARKNTWFLITQKMLGKMSDTRLVLKSHQNPVPAHPSACPLNLEARYTKVFVNKCSRRAPSVTGGKGYLFGKRCNGHSPAQRERVPKLARGGRTRIR